MKHSSIPIVLLLFSISLSQANSPSMIPWPVGSSISATNNAKTLMASYGEFTNGWGNYHRGIDIDENTEAVNGNYVRCVEDGFVRRRIPTSSGWTIVISPTLASENGWVYGHLDALNQPNPEGKVWELNEEISKGDLIQVMDPDLIGPNHLHFSWGEVWDVGISLVNPLDCFGSVPPGEVEEPEGSDYWQFNPEGYSPAYKFLILPENLSSGWSGWSISEVEALSKPSNSIDGNVDLFFGVTLQGVGMGSVPEDSTNCNPERVFWELVRDEVSGPNILSQNYVVNFDCTLSGDDEEARMFYFRHRMWDMFGGNRAPLMCLTNCGDTQGWESLGIDNIEENYWRTNKNYAYPNETTINPVLAEYPDGSYSIDVTCFAHINDLPPNPEVTFDASIPCELHNFSPALREVSIIDLVPVPDQTYYHGEWEPNDLSAELVVSDNNPASAGAELQIILLFTESINTGSLSAVLGPLAVGNGQWSSSVVENDTWTGEVTLPAEEVDGSYILSVDADDMDGSHLMDPEGTGTVPGPTRDTHHSLLVGFETGLEWTVSVHGTVFGSPKLADLDLDGDLDVIIQSADGWVDVLGDDGSSIPGWPVDGGWISGPDVMASPSIVDLTASSTPEILAVHPYGCNAFESSGLPASPWMSNWGGGLVYYPAWSSPVASDLDNNGDFELVLGRQNITLGSNPISLYIRDTDGSLIKYKLWDMEESVTATPSICDVDENGSLEVIAVTDLTEFFPGLDGYGTVYCFNPITGDELWSKYVGGVYITGAISTGKILADETVGVVVGAHTGSNSIKVLNGTTGNLAYSPLATAGGIQAGTSIADVNGDGHLDIVASSVGGYLYCWRGDTGEDNPGFPVNLGAFTDDGVSIGDVDGDGMLELVLAGSDGKLHAINHDGTSTSGFPITVSSCNDLSGQPAIGDIDGDGRLEIVFSEENNSVLHCYEMGDNSAYNYLPWPQFQHDAQNTGYFPTDITPPAEPTSFEGDGELTGDIFTVDLTWTVSVNDPSSTAPQQPTDVVSYRIYRKIPPRPIEQIATLPAGTSAYTDVITFTSFPYPSVVAYFASAWDGVNESDFTPVTKVLTGSLENIALGCPAREIFHSTSIRTSQNLTVACSYFSDRGQINSCRTLTDGEYDAVYSPSSSSNCVEIDLGGMFTINDVVVMGTDQALCETPLYELSRDGRNFSHIDSGRARYVRVYSSAGATEIEVLGLSYQETSTQVEVRRSNSEGYRIVAIEEGSPITATVFDLSGRSVWRGSSSTGEILWNRSNSSGNSVPSGVYLIMVESDDMETVTAKVVVR